LDVNVRPAFWSSRSDIHDTLVKAIERTDILKLSAEEAAFVSEQSSLPQDPRDRSWLKFLGDALLERGPRLVMITLGAEGALLLTTSHQVEIPARPVRPLDTTGAGDAFMGAVLYKLVQQGCTTFSDLLSLSENDLTNIGNFGSFAAGLSVTSYGGMSSFPFIYEVNDFSTSQKQGKEPLGEMLG
jgi:fructokinase